MESSDALLRVKIIEKIDAHGRAHDRYGYVGSVIKKNNGYYRVLFSDGKALWMTKDQIRVVKKSG